MITIFQPAPYSSCEILEYLRKSRSDDPNLSVEEVLKKHENLLYDFSSRTFDAPIPQNHIFREVASSETIDGRPMMLKLLKQIESPAIKAVLVVDVQRLSRGDLEDAGRLIKLLRFTNTDVITPQKTYHLQDEYDRDIFERELKRGNDYLEYFKKIQARGRLLSVQEGNFIGSIAPYGYQRTWITIDKKKCPTLVENKEQAEIVRMIFDMYGNRGMSKNAICSHLDEMGIKPPKGTHWSPASLKDLLTNVHYIGKIKWNWRKTVTTVKDSQVIHSRPKNPDDRMIFEGKHASIVDRELFDKVQSRLGKHPRLQKSKTLRNPLAGLLFCQCGSAMSLRTYQKNGAETAKPRYVCSNHSHCKTGSAVTDEILERVCLLLKKHIGEFDVDLKATDSEKKKEYEQQLSILKKKLSDLEEKELMQWEKYAIGEMPKPIFEKLNQQVLAQKKELLQQMENTKKDAPKELLDPLQKKMNFQDALDALRDEEVCASSKNLFLKEIIDKMVYTREMPVRITRNNYEQLGISPHSLKTGANWHTSDFTLDILFKL